MAAVDFKISLVSVSKAVAGLEEELGMRRRGTAVIVGCHAFLFAFRRFDFSPRPAT